MGWPGQAPEAALKGGQQQPRIAILVLGCLMTVYDRCIRTIRATWGSKAASGVDIYYVYGGQTSGHEPGLVSIEHLIGRSAPTLQDDAVWVSGDIILCGAADVYEGQHDCILRKRLIAFGYLAHQQRYDFVYTVCATSYVDVDALQRYAKDLPSKGVYQGPLNVHSSSGSPFVSGASMLLSRDMAAALADDAADIIASNTDGLPDDVAFGRWIADNYCAESRAEICNRIAAEKRATDGQAFVRPNDMEIINFVMAPAYIQIPKEKAYHYHFHSGRMWEMEHFHRRFFMAALPG